MNRIVKRPQAIQDLADIVDYISTTNADAALRFLSAVEQSLTLLAGMPEIGGCWVSSRPECIGVRLWLVRRFPSCVIIYKKITDGIEIVRVVHGSRDFERIDV